MHAHVAAAAAFDGPSRAGTVRSAGTAGTVRSASTAGSRGGSTDLSGAPRTGEHSRAGTTRSAGSARPRAASVDASRPAPAGVVGTPAGPAVA